MGLALHLWALEGEFLFECLHFPSETAATVAENVAAIDVLAAVVVVVDVADAVGAVALVVFYVVFVYVQNAFSVL